MQYYYHADHLGSSSYITNLDAQIVQHVEYVPFGEVFIEERNQSWNTPYLFNGKELDEETGLYYYGARYYKPRESVWLSVDPLAERYPNYSPYAYTFQNPIKYIDPRGLEGLEPGDPPKEREIDEVVIISKARSWFNRNIIRPIKNIFRVKIKNSITHETKLSVDVGLLQVSDGGTRGYEIKGPTIRAGEITVGSNKNDGAYLDLYNPLYEIATGGDLKGTLISGKLETGKVDVKAGVSWKLKDVTVPVLGQPAIHPNEVEITPYFGVGMPWAEFKIEKSYKGIKVNYGIQEDIGKSFYNIIGIKGDFKLEGKTEINW
nr:RHS repeat-associated core domain-containing protein [Apibacter adventoris]